MCIRDRLIGLAFVDYWYQCNKPHSPLLVDIGGGTTDIAIFKSGAIQFTGVLPIAGDQVTSDIAQALRTPTPQAEEIKQKH